MKAAIERMTQDEAMELTRTLAEKFGFVGTYFTREDAESRIDRAMTDDEWARLRESRAWRKSIEGMMIEYTWDLIEWALDDAGIAAAGETGGDNE